MAARLARSALALAMLAASTALALAQAGSTGGTIGKQNKSVSGGEEKEVRPATPPPATRKSRAPARAAPQRESAPSINGRWLVSQSCNHGKFEIELDLKQASATEFSGTSRGITTGASSQIVDGKIDGNGITFVRRAAGLADRWTARLTAPGRFTGTSKGPVWSCTYTARRQ